MLSSDILFFQVESGRYKTELNKLAGTLVGLLRDNGGRMASQALIARFSPLDGAGKRRLAAIVQKTCKTVLPEQTSGGSSGATVVLREMFVWEQTEARAATRIQRAQRERQEARSKRLEARGRAVEID